MTAPSDEPAWMRRSVERSLRGATLRAQERVESFLTAAHAVIAAKGLAEFNVQDVLDHSTHSWRSFYRRFESKQDLLLAVFEDILAQSADRLRDTVVDDDVPALERLRTATVALFELSSSGHPASAVHDLAALLHVSHPAQINAAFRPVIAVFAELTERAQRAGALRRDADPRRMAAMMVPAVMVAARTLGDSDERTRHPITAEEVWGLCIDGIIQP
ncbi:TetR/AcrR family transcriptional regulator [Nocardia miyunensis]|uniref:TetR/AcrR family transcriptional regulator n=1 Tax=Nocardia miyunensis TaxID=282684 RepID=UPI00082F9263|nr:TetR/AcrR family transcriptional regulator [Nocardia miyunensis]